MPSESLVCCYFESLAMFWYALMHGMLDSGMDLKLQGNFQVADGVKENSECEDLKCIKKSGIDKDCGFQGYVFKDLSNCNIISLIVDSSHDGSTAISSVLKSFESLKEKN